MTAPTKPTCSRCGEPVTPGARFCMKCGTEVSDLQGAVATAMMPAPVQEPDPNEALLELLRQATLGEYEILKELGRGGMATVYLGHDIALDRKVAVKVMAPALLLMGEGMSERFKREARTAANLSHPNIIPIYTVKSAGKTLYFVMKFIAGRSLEAIIGDTGPMPVPMARAILQQVGNALGYAHRNGIIHRDIKPANIMIDEEGWAVVTDFGIAKVAENRGLTMTGIAVGTPSYMSPEQCAAKDITGKSDQYSLGVVAYEMLTGQQPFKGDSAMAIMYAHFNEQPNPLMEMRPDCPPALADAVMRMLEKSPDKRWPSMEEAIAALGVHHLAHDDPYHRQLQQLARKGSTRELLRTIPPPPTSPVPPAKTRPVVEQATTPIPAPKVIGLSLAPEQGELYTGDTLQLIAGPKFTGGTGSGFAISWSSSSDAVASVSARGLVTAHTPGVVTITASLEGFSATAKLAVSLVPVANVLVVPVEPKLVEGESLQFRAMVEDRRGAPVLDRTIRWSVSPRGPVEIDGAGLATARSEGIAEVAAECEGVRGATRVRVELPPVASLVLTPSEGSVTVGEVLTFAAEPRDKHGKALAGREVTWRSGAEKLATISARGIVTGMAEGTVEITAECAGQTATASVVVKPAPVASVTIAQPAPVVAGERIELAATLKDARGHILSGRAIKWSSSSPGVATVTQAGQLTGMGAGTAKVTAESEGKSWTVQVTVLPVPVAEVKVEGAPERVRVGDSATLHAVLKDAKGHLLTGREVTWSVSPSNAATITGGGVFKGIAAGAVTVTARVEGKSAEVKLAVVAPTPVPPPKPEPVLPPKPEPVPPPKPEPAPPPKLESAPPIPAVDQVAPTEVITPRRAPEPPKPKPSEPALARVPAAPIVQVPPPVVPEAAVPGAAEVVEAPAGKGKLIGALAGVVVLAVAGFMLFGRGGGGEIPVAPPPPSVEPAPVASVELTGDGAPVAVGRTQQLSALLKGPGGEELNGRTVQWTSSDPAVAVVSPIGAVTAKKTGTVTISALSEGKSGSVILSIVEPDSDQPAAVGAVAIAGPPSRTVDLGETTQLQASLRDAKGTALTDRAIVWTTSDPAVVLVTSAGLVTPVGAGGAKVLANSEGKSAEVRFTVRAPKEPEPVAPVEVATVAVAPASASVVEGSTVQLTATAFDAGRNALTDRNVGWRSSDESIATVSDDGLVTGASAGTATITATIEGKSAATRVSVTEPPPSSVPVAAVTLNAPQKSLKVGEKTTWSAIARDQRGRDLGDRGATWSSGDQKVATVDDAGVITAVGPGSAEIRVTVESKRAAERITVAAPPTPVVTNPPPAPPVSGPTTGTAASALLPKREVEAGSTISCGVAAGGAVCWGAGTGLALVNGTAGITGLTVGRGHACGLLPGGRAVCWGDNRMGQLGDGTVGTAIDAVEVGGGMSFSMLSAGGSHTCGIAGGKAYCWGRGKDGQLGDGSNSDRRRPVAVRGQSFTTISAGGDHSCGLTAAGKAYCWGDGYSGQLGFGAQDTQNEPIDVSGNHKFTRITAGAKHTCALTGEGKAFCWGANESGQLGDASKSDRSAPQPVAGTQSFSAIAAGGTHTCALTGGGEAFCWGDNKAGQVGDGTKTLRNAPVPVSGGLSFANLSAGEAHSCGLTRGGEAVCWGRNDKMQLGDGGTAARAAPAPVVER